jgi:hypothetical protein
LLAAPALAFETPVTVANLDSATFTEWVAGAQQPVQRKAGAAHVIWTRTTAPEWDGIHFGQGNAAGPRHLRIGFTATLAVGSVLVRGGCSLSVLKPTAAYPGDMADERQWLAAQRLVGRGVGADEPSNEGYLMWILPPGTTTRALRLTHVPALTDRVYEGWTGGLYVFADRFVNLAPQALADSSANRESVVKINDESNNGTWGAWELVRSPDQPVISADNPAWVELDWPRPVTLRGLCALWIGAAAGEALAFTGPADRHPRESTDADWTSLGKASGWDSQYPRQLGPNFLDFGQTVTTRAVRLLITKVTATGHPHVQGKTLGGRRTWLGELMALAPLDAAEIKTAILPEPATPDLGHAPIPVRFHLAAPAHVTLVIEDAAGHRVRNLVSDMPFPAGDNTAWWDGSDDLGRDPESARHGIYNIPNQPVAPGTYRVRGLTHGQVDLHFEFSIYNAGHPAWETADNTGCWLTNHTPPQAALYVPGDRSPTGAPLVYLGSYVSEGGHGLAWVDLDGKKVGGRGWVGGNWTAAPYLCRDAGEQRDANTWLYVGSAWHDDRESKTGELRLTAITTKGDKNVARYTFAKGSDAAVTGIAVRDGLLVAALPKEGKLLFVDAKAGKVLGPVALDDARGVFWQPDGKLLALSGHKLLRLTVDAADLKAEAQTVVDGLEDPQAVTLDKAGNLYISDRGASHQVKVFDAEGKAIRSIGHPGAPHVGAYDPEQMHNPCGLTIDERDRLWVAEQDYQPKRVSQWSLDGKLLKAFYGPSEYGGGGRLDGRDPSRFYYHGMEFKLDWRAGTDQLADVFWRPGPEDQKMPDGFGCDGMPEYPIYAGGRQYLTNCYNSNPTNGCSTVGIWLLDKGVARPVAVFGRANDWSALKDDAFKVKWPAGVDLRGDYWRNQAVGLWCDVNGDGHCQPDEVIILRGSAGGVTVGDDLSLIVSRLDGTALRLPVQRFTDAGAPIYDLAKADKLAGDVQPPMSSGGDQALASPDGWTVLSNGVKPYTGQSVCGVFRGEARWQYPNLWPGLHAGHEAPAPDRPGELIAVTRMLGGFIAPKGSDAGRMFGLNGNMGPLYLITEDGLFVTQLFQDIRQGLGWGMPTAQRGMLLNDVSPHDENFWPSLTQLADGRIFLVDGGRTSLVRVDGLETTRRLPDARLTVSGDDLKACAAWTLEAEARRQAALGHTTLRVPLRAVAPTVDGKLDDWAGADWAVIDRRGVAAYFNSNSKPYDVTASLAISGDRLYAAFRTGDANLLHNAGGVANAPFKTGGALDIMLGVDPAAKPNRAAPVAGDERLLVSQVGGKTLALLYRAVVPGTKEPVPFSSPWRTITLDRVDDVSAEVQLAGSKDGDFELSIPLATLGLTPTAGVTLSGDVGILRGDGGHTVQRSYWSNKATAITADVPSEAQLTPNLWGRFQLVAETPKG